ncbi:hypothetical protein ASC87_15610 [Rhizobacter sp. Root1221]|nr:hypothetical protein ASC87_15610 [Rhizobacter sp. Root1221]
MNEVTPIAEPAESARFEDLFREPGYAHDHPMSFALARKQDTVDALRGLFAGSPALAKLRLWCFLTLASHPQGRLSREDVNQLFHAVLPEPLDAVLKRLRDLGLLVWDATAQDYHLSTLAHQVQALLAPLTSAPQDDDELSGLLAQVAGAQQLGVVDASQLQHLHAQLARLHDEFADAIASGSEARLRLAQPRFDRALTLVDKAGQALSAIIGDHGDNARLEKAARALGQDQARLLSMASQFTRALQQADRLRVTLGSTGLTSSDVRHWLQHHQALHELIGDALSVGVRPVFVSQHDLVDVAEGELERDRPDPERSMGLPPALQAEAGSLDILSLPPELGHLVNLFGRWHKAAPAEDDKPHTLADAVLNRRFAHAAYRMQLMPLLGDRQAGELKSQTGELARAPWSLTMTTTLVKTPDTEVAVISEGHFHPRPHPRPVAAAGTTPIPE